MYHFRIFILMQTRTIELLVKCQHACEIDSCPSLSYGMPSDVCTRRTKLSNSICVQRVFLWFQCDRFLWCANHNTFHGRSIQHGVYVPNFCEQVGLIVPRQARQHRTSSLSLKELQPLHVRVELWITECATSSTALHDSIRLVLRFAPGELSAIRALNGN